MTTIVPVTVPSTVCSMVMENIAANPAAMQVADGAIVPMTGDHNGGTFVTPLHGPHYAGAARGNLFYNAGQGTTGHSVLAPGGTTSGFCFGNLTGSGVYMEIHKLRVVPVTQNTGVPAALGLEYGVCPVSTTYQTSVAMPLGTGAAPVCKVWNAVTIVANAWLRSLPAFITGGYGWEFIFDGDLVIQAGDAVNLVATSSQGTNKFLVDIEWSEWPT